MKFESSRELAKQGKTTQLQSIAADRSPFDSTLAIDLGILGPLKDGGGAQIRRDEEYECLGSGVSKGP
jgi:hypothetical protein